MYGRGSANRELFTRSGDPNSERWSQQFMSDSQDWGTQLFCSQETQRPSGLSLKPPSVMQQNLSQGSNRGGPGISNRVSSQPLGPVGDVSLARDIRFGLHTILSVMRELPDQLKELSCEVVRNSQQPEETNKLIKETSEELQGLVIGLEKKLSQLLDNKENSDLLQQSLSERGDQLCEMINKVQDLGTQTREEDQAKLEKYFSETKDELQKEIKKIQEAIHDLKGSDSVVTSLTLIRETMIDLLKRIECLDGTVIGVLEDKYSSVKQNVDQVLNLSKENWKEVHITQNKIIEKLTLLPQDIRTCVKEAVSEALQHYQSQTYGGSNPIFSPADYLASYHRPMLPLSESSHRYQVSPVAQVLPQKIVRPGTQEAQKVVKPLQTLVAPANHSAQMFSNGFLTASLSKPSATDFHMQEKPLVSQNSRRPLTRVAAAKYNVCSNILHEKTPQNIGKDDNVNTSTDCSKICSGLKVFATETQQFTPESISSKSNCDSEDLLIVHYDSGSSSSDECPLDVPAPNNSKNAIREGRQEHMVRAGQDQKSYQSAFNQRKNLLGYIEPRESSSIQKPITTPNVRQTPVMMVSNKTEYLSSKCKLSQLENRSLATKFVVPIQPVPVKNSKFNDARTIGQLSTKSSETPVNYTFENTQTRRFLTPMSKVGLRFRMSSRKRKI